MKFEIKIENRAAGVAVIDIEGVIGVPETIQGTGEGGASTYAEFRTKLHELGDDIEEVVVNIRSTGGDVNDALLIFEALNGLDKKVVTRCYGYTASAATIIAQSASEGCREISKDALYLIHQSLTSAEGNANELEETREMLKQTDERLVNIYTTRSGRDSEEFRTLMAENRGRGRWMNAEETIERGLADRVIQAKNISPKNNKKMDKNKEKVGLFHTIVVALASALGVENPIDNPEPEVSNIELATRRGGRLVVDIPDGEEMKVGDKCTAYITPEGESVSPDGFHALEDGREVIVSGGVIEEIREPDGDFERANARIAELEGMLADANAKAVTDEQAEILALVARVGGKAKIEKMASNYHPAPRKVDPVKKTEAKTDAELIADLHREFRDNLKKK